MKSITDTAPFPLAILTIILDWTSQYLYRKLQQEDQNNPWIQMEKMLDFKPIETACSSYFKRTSGIGIKHTTPKLVRVLFVKIYLGYSLRKTESAIRYNIAIRRFVGYGLFDPPPDHTTIERFEVWVAEHHPRLYFDTVLKQIDGTEPAKQTVQYGDSYAMEANAAKQGLVQRLRASCHRLETAIGEDEAFKSSGFPQEQVYGKEDEPLYFLLSSAERTERLQQTVMGAVWLVEWVRAQQKMAQARGEWVAVIEKIITDEIALIRDETGNVTSVKRLSKKDRGSYRIISATDTDATWRMHGEGKEDFGYNVNVMMDEDFIREIQAETGASPDAQPLGEMLQAQEAYHGQTPEKLVYDQAAGTGKAVAQIEAATDGETQLVVRLRPTKKKDSDLFGPSDFVYNDKGTGLICPNGVETHRQYASKSGQGWQFHFLRKNGCEDCPLIQKCYKNPTIQKMRQVFISDYRPQWDEAKAYEKSDSFKEEMGKRYKVEQTIGILTRHCGARRAQRCGLKYADYQAKMCGMVFNVKRWLTKKRQAEIASTKGAVGLMVAS